MYTNNEEMKMWHPFKPKVRCDYDYRRTQWYKRTASFTLRCVAHVIVGAVDYVFLGYRVRGRKNIKALKGEGFVTVCNHIHPLDCTMVDLAMFPRRMFYVSLDTNFGIPVVRHIIRWLGAIPLSKSPKNMANMFYAMNKEVKRGSCVHIYPEGSLIPYCRSLREFKSGAFRFAVKSNVPVLPMIIEQIPPYGIYKLYKRKPCLQLTVLPAIYNNANNIGTKEASTRICNECRRRMMKKTYKIKG